MRRFLALSAVTALVLAGCGAEDGDDTATATTTTSVASSTSSEPTDPTSTTSPSGGDPAPDPADLPGEVFDMFPYEDAELAVVGVDREDVLNLRTGPGTNFAVLEELAPTDTGLVATGHNRLVDDAIWVELTVDGQTGWVNGQYVLQPGEVNDVTSELGESPQGETMIDLAEAVADLRASVEPPSRIVIVEDPTVGDLGEIKVDVIGLGDDSVGGERLHIFAMPGDGGEGFSLRSVESTTLCLRGVSDDLLCL